MKLLLASASPRRKKLMREHGFRFTIFPSGVSERVPAGLSAAGLVKHLALKKALAISKKHPEDVVLGSDTIVFINGHVIGKPRNPKHAAKILKELSGNWQQVHTGVAVVWKGGSKKRVSNAVSYVKFRSLSDEEIEGASRKHLDKAGAYAVQEKGDSFVKAIKGDYDNVVGLPMRVVKRLLRSWNRSFHSLPKRIGNKRHFKA